MGDNRMADLRISVTIVCNLMTPPTIMFTNGHSALLQVIIGTLIIHSAPPRKINLSVLLCRQSTV